MLSSRLRCFPVSRKITFSSVATSSAASSSFVDTLCFSSAAPQTQQQQQYVFNNISSSSSSSLFKSTRTLLQSSSSSHDEEPKRQENFSVPSWTDPNARNLYTRLGLRSSAQTNDIKKHYRHLAKLYHPDSNGGNEESNEKFRKIKEAYETLSNTDKRKVYDSTGMSGSDQEQAGFGGARARASQWSGSGLHGKYHVRWDENGRPHFEVPRWIFFIMFFSIGMFISAFRDLRNRRRDKQIPEDGSSEQALGIQRSGLWRPFITMVLLMSFLPRLPAAICCWYFYVYRPTIQAEDRATMDNVTIIMNDQFNGTAVNMTLNSPFLQMAQRKFAAKVKDADEYLMTVTLRPITSGKNNNNTSDDQQPTMDEIENSQQGETTSTITQEVAIGTATEFPNGATNNFTMSFPRPRSADGKQILPCTATVRVKRVIREGAEKKINMELSPNIFERQLTLM